MKKEIAEKWVAALRSGKYKQCADVLCQVEEGEARRYCCLGVLCELAVAEGVVRRHPPHECEEDPRIIQAYGEDGDCYTLLPGEVLLWAGMASVGGDFADSTSAALTTMNDDGKTFEEIANVIESRREEL